MADAPIIVIKKKGGHAGHHGRAWKVAYADFVTAMMAFFLVMWLLSSSKPVQEAVGGYFRDPSGTAQKKGTELNGASAAKEGKEDDLNALKQQLTKSLEKMSNFDKLKDQIEITITPEGLRIEMMEGANGTFFENGKSQPTPALQDLLQVLSTEIGKLPNTLSIEGHTDAKPFSSSGGYGNWELSTDRANIARRLMEGSGLKPDQVVQVRGFADRNLRKPAQPEDPSNRRVTVIVQDMPKGMQRPSFVFNGKLPDAALPAPATASAIKKEEKPKEEKK